MTVTGASKVRATKVRQAHKATKRIKPGQPYNGPNLVPQRPPSAKKTARKVSARKSAT
jgi:hypothetical protein